MTIRRRGRNRLIFFIGLVVCASVTLIHRTAANHKRVDPFLYAARGILLVPPLTAENSIYRENRITMVSLFAVPRLAGENARLKSRVAALEVQNAALRDEAAENLRLRQMLDLPARVVWKARAADVVALKPTPMRDTALLALAHTGDAHVQDVVLDTNGDLVGQVTQVTGSSCDALLLTDPLSSVGARVVANGRPQPGKAVVGICVGNRSRLLELIDLPGDADIEPGDQIVTSGLGGVYPPMIRIGSVTDVQIDTARFLKSATVAPNADFNGLREVFLRQ